MRRGSLWIAVAGTVCLFVLAGVECVALEKQGVRERLARFVEEHDAKQAQARREAVYGDTLDDNAWDHYAQASAALASQRIDVMPAAPDRWWKLAYEKQPLGDDVAPEIEAALDAALRSIRAGVRCATVRRDDRNMSPFHLRALVDRAMDRAFAASDTRQLAELFVDHCTLLQDLDRHVWCCTPFRDDWLRGLDAESAAWFGTSLLRVEERSRWCGSLETRLAALVKWYAPLTPLQQSFEAGLGAWRFGFDSNWRELVVCDRIVAVLPDLVPPAADWPRRQAQLAEVHAALKDFDGSNLCPGQVRGVAVQSIYDLVKNEERWLRMSFTRLRMLRLAVAFVHGLELPRLDDPLGSGPIEVEIRGDEATFRSEGMMDKQRIARTVRRR